MKVSDRFQIVVTDRQLKLIGREKLTRQVFDQPLSADS
jgi:hypothetical protein